MKYIILSNTSSGVIMILEPKSLKIKNIYLETIGSKSGPSAIECYKNKIIVINSYSNSLSILDIEKEVEESNHYIGPYPNDIKILDDLALVVCSESNSLVGFNLKDNKIDFEVVLGEFPYGIAVNIEEQLAYVSNMNDNSISIVNIDEKKVVKEVKLEQYPSKLIYSPLRKRIYALESFLGSNENGYVVGISTEDFTIKERVEVGKGPVELYENGDYLYVSNMEDGSISIININLFKEIQRIYIGGMPKGILFNEDKIYVADYLKGIINVIDIIRKKIKTITVGEEPNAMILYNSTI
ncbi:MAG: YncE family protein [Clostridium sp.]